MTSPPTSSATSPTERDEGDDAPEARGAWLGVLLAPFRLVFVTVPRFLFVTVPRFLFVTVPLCLVVALPRTLRATGPILKREFIGLLRTRKGFRITLVTLVASSLLPLFSWPDPGEPMAFQTAMIAFEIYRGVFNFALFLFVPAVTASAITMEREQNTHELLFMTHITNRQLVLGKLLAASAFFWLLVVFTFPVACTLYLIGGFAIWDFLVTGFGMIFFILSLAMIGLSCSVRNQVSAKSIFQAYTFTFLLGLMAAYGGVAGGFLISQMVSVLSFFGPGTWVWLGVYGAFAFIGLLFGLDLLLSFRSLARFQQLSARHPVRRVMRAADLRLRRKKRTSYTALTKLVLARTTPGVPDGWNPFFVLSLRNDLFGSAVVRRVLFWGGASICGLVILMLKVSDVGMTTAAAVCAMLVLHCVALLFPAPCASTITSELEPRLLELLRGTYLGAQELFRGKLLSIFFAVSGLAVLGAGLCTICALFAGAWRQLLGVMNVALWFLTALPVVVLVVATGGFLAAVLSRKTMQAQIVSYTLSVGYLLGLPAILYGFVENEALAFGSSPLFAFSPIWLESYERFDPLEAGPNVIFASSLLVGCGVAILQYILAVAVYRTQLARD